MPKISSKIDRCTQQDLRLSKIGSYWQTRDEGIRFYLGHVTDVLAKLPSESVHCVMTSPPYWALRDYKSGTMEMGSEETVEEYLVKMIVMFNQVKRVLRNDGTLWLNIGDSYSGCNMVGVPWRLALALQAQGWILRQDIIWHKPSPMPESVNNRCTKSHEYVFLFTKNREYFYDAEAIKETASTADVPDYVSHRNKRSVWTISAGSYSGKHFATFPKKLVEPCIKAGTSEHGCCASCGSPWERLVEKVEVKSGEREKAHKYGKETEAYEPGRQGHSFKPTTKESIGTIGWQPICECNGKIVKRKGIRLGYGKYHSHSADGVEYALRQDGLGPKRIPGEPTKEIATTFIEYVSDLPLEDHPIVPCTVLDPFIGSGTTAEVCLDLGRNCIGIDLSQEYLDKHAIRRIEGCLRDRQLWELLPLEAQQSKE